MPSFTFYFHLYRVISCSLSLPVVPLYRVSFYAILQDFTFTVLCQDFTFIFSVYHKVFPLNMLNYTCNSHVWRQPLVNYVIMWLCNNIINFLWWYAIIELRKHKARNFLAGFFFFFWNRSFWGFVSSFVIFFLSFSLFCILHPCLERFLSFYLACFRCNEPNSILVMKMDTIYHCSLTGIWSFLARLSIHFIGQSGSISVVFCVYGPLTTTKTSYYFFYSFL